MCALTIVIDDVQQGLLILLKLLARLGPVIGLQVQVIGFTDQLDCILGLHSLLGEVSTFVVEQTMRVTAPCYSLHKHTTQFVKVNISWF